MEKKIKSLPIGEKKKSGKGMLNNTDPKKLQKSTMNNWHKLPEIHKDEYEFPMLSIWHTGHLDVLKWKVLPVPLPLMVLPPPAMVQTGPQVAPKP